VIALLFTLLVTAMERQSGILESGTERFLVLIATGKLVAGQIIFFSVSSDCKRG
jgi:hypothetical protein